MLPGAFIYKAQRNKERLYERDYMTQRLKQLWTIYEKAKMRYFFLFFVLSGRGIIKLYLPRSLVRMLILLGEDAIGIILIIVL
jgi:hypothetical protein